MSHLHPWFIATQRKHIVAHLADKADRDAYVRYRIESGVAAQIHAMRRSRRWSQADMAARLGKPQPLISRLEDWRHGRHSVSTLLEVASLFDVALLVAFAPFSELADREAARDCWTVAVRPYLQDDELHLAQEPAIPDSWNLR